MVAGVVFRIFSRSLSIVWSMFLMVVWISSGTPSPMLLRSSTDLNVSSFGVLPLLFCWLDRVSLFCGWNEASSLSIISWWILFVPSLLKSLTLYLGHRSWEFSELFYFEHLLSLSWLLLEFPLDSSELSSSGSSSGGPFALLDQISSSFWLKSYSVDSSGASEFMYLSIKRFISLVLMRFLCAKVIGLLSPFFVGICDGIKSWCWFSSGCIRDRIPVSTILPESVELSLWDCPKLVPRNNPGSGVLAGWEASVLVLISSGMLSLIAV